MKKMMFGAAALIVILFTGMTGLLSAAFHLDDISDQEYRISLNEAAAIAKKETKKHNISSIHFAVEKELQHLEPVEVSLELMYAFDEAFHQDMPLHEATWSTHSCFLAYKGKIVYSCEDIGRHNALDKAIGYALMHDYDFHECAVFTTGRLPIDMITKVIRAGIPLVASKKTPTAEAVKLAQEYGLTMIGRAKNHKMMQYTLYKE